MRFSKILTAAGLSMALGGFAPCAFAQAGGAGGAGGGAVSGMPATSGGGQSLTNRSPAAGQPGTQAPASAAPVGNASSDYMSNEGANGATDSSMSGPAASNSETRTRWWETKVERDIVAARADGLNVSKAQHQKWLGSTALSKGDRPGATRHFERAERDLRAEGFRVSSNNVQYRNSSDTDPNANANDSRSNLHANETSQNPNAANMHSNQGNNAAY